MSETVQANDGAMLPLSSLYQTFTYSGGFLTQITVFYAGQTYIQFFVNDGTNITYVSGWINPNYPVPDAIMDTTEGDTMVTTEGDVMVLTPAA
jgi:hypothetical protein